MAANRVYFYGEMLAGARKRKGLTQEDLARELNITQEEISDYENEVRGCYVHRAKKIVDFFGEKWDNLIRGEIPKHVDTKKPLIDQDELTYSEIIKVCTAQINAEISSMVGNKFIPELYIDREIQDQVERFIRPECYDINLLSQVEKCIPIIFKNHSLIQYKNIIGKRSRFINLIKAAQSIKDKLDDDSPLIKLIQFYLREINGRIDVIIGKAGTGKTNLLCHLAKHYANKQPTIFLTGRSGISENFSIKDLIEARLNKYYPSHYSKENLFDQCISHILKNDTSLLIFFDAINEHRDIDLLSTAIAQFLHEIKGKPINILASCRDVYWPFFDTFTWPNSQYSIHDKVIDEYSISEFYNAIEVYFNHYKINATLSKEAKEKLSHPLMLRFFCETYGDPSLPYKKELQKLDDIRLKFLFDEYLTKKLYHIQHTAPNRRRTSREIMNFLYYIANSIRQKKAREVYLDEISSITNLKDLESPESTYVAILGEDIIIEEEPEVETERIKVLFTYEEFMEYLIARTMILNSYPLTQEKIKILVDECKLGVDVFPSYKGVYEYIAIILREDHNVNILDVNYSDLEYLQSNICNIISKLKPELINNNDIMILNPIIYFTDRKLRETNVHCISKIIQGCQYEKILRKQTVKLAKEILMYENDVCIRAIAMDCFDKIHVSSLSKIAQNIANWWENNKKEITKKIILLSDDEINIIKLYCEVLKEEGGFENIYYSSNSLEIIDIANKVKPDLIITDYYRPGLNGYELAIAIKENPLLKNVPIILISGGAKYTDHLSNVFSGFLPKPFLPKIFLKSVQIALTGKFKD